MIPSRIHGVLDYSVAILLIASPWLFGFDDGTAAQWLPIVLGIVTIIYSMITKYEAGLMPAISYRTHLGLDILNGTLLAASPWLFGFHDHVYLPHLVMGLMELMVVGLSRKVAFA